MNYTALGNTGINVSRIGFGGIPIQRCDADSVIGIFEKLIECKVNYIDTARGYTVSEGLIGNAIEKLGVRERLVLATKSMARDRAGMEKDIKTSLNNLRTNYIDLYQIHNPTMAQLDAVLADGGAIEALLEAKQKGVVGHIGLTAHDVAVFERAIGLDDIETIMFPYNIVETQGEELVRKCAESGKAFIAMKPMAGGAIEDAAAAMRFLLSNPYVTVVIPGMYCEREVEENTGFSCEPLTVDEEARIASIRKELTGNFCRRCGYCAPCTVGINIPGVFLFYGYLDRYGLDAWAKSRYAGLSEKASNCIKCGECEPRCPYGLPIRDMLVKASEAFGE